MKRGHSCKMVPRIGLAIAVLDFIVLARSLSCNVRCMIVCSIFVHMNQQPERFGVKRVAFGSSFRRCLPFFCSVWL